MQYTYKLKNAKMSSLMLDAEQVLDLIKSNIDCTAIEVFPTNVIIPNGTVDSLQSLGDIFNWNIEDLVIQSQNFTGYQYTYDVPIADILQLEILATCKKEDSNIVIEFGDGTVSDVKNDDIVSEGNGIYEYSSNGTVIIRHKYVNQYVNRKNIVKIYGNTYCRLRTSGINNETGAVDLSRSLVSRVFENDLPIAACLQNVSSAFKKSLRILAINVPFLYDFKNIINIYAMFEECQNLVNAYINASCNFYFRHYYSCARVFCNCHSLKNSNVYLPSCVESSSTDSYDRFYYNCMNLESNVNDLIPKIGFANRIVALNLTFCNCSSMIGDMSSCANVLWNDTSKVWQNTEKTFFGCRNVKNSNPYWGAGSQTKVKVSVGANEQVNINAMCNQQESAYVFLCKIDWGDGSYDEIQTRTLTQLTHIYESAGEYEIVIDSNCAMFNFKDQPSVIEVMQLGDQLANMTSAFCNCGNLEKICNWGLCAYNCTDTYNECTSLTGPIPQWSENAQIARRTYRRCISLSGSIPPWNDAMRIADYTYGVASSLTGEIPEWTPSIVIASYTYFTCRSLSSTIPEWNDSIYMADGTYYQCTNVRGLLPKWNNAISSATATYRSCPNLSDVATYDEDELMPSTIIRHDNTVTGCNASIRSRFLTTWGGTKTE